MNNPYLPLRLKDLAVSERPQERLEQHGAAALSDTELLALLLRSGSRGVNVLEVAQKLITDAGSLAELVKWHDTDFRQVKGIGPVKTAQLITVLEIARRVRASEREVAPVLNRPALVLAHFQPLLAGLAIEKFWVLCLNRKNRLLKLVEITSGTATSSLAHPREVFRQAIRHGACAIICVHNHPSGDPAPSAADIQVTRQLREAAKTVDIEMTDHVILGNPAADPRGVGFYSFREAGML